MTPSENGLAGAPHRARRASERRESLAASLEGTGLYRVLRRVPDLVASPPTRAAGDAAVGLGVALDTETTGIDVRRCEVVELAMVAFEYLKADGTVLGVVGTFSGLQQPSEPIPPQVSRLTGITDADVAGHAIDDDAVAAFVAGADVVLAHNSGFDRPVAERRWPCFAALPWGCSCRDVDWAAEGFEGARLGHLVMQAGLYHRGHRALDDVAAMLALLSRRMPSSGRTGLDALLRRARVGTVRIWAEGAPYAAKGILKERGYGWSDGSGGAPRAWHREVPERDLGAEVAFLRDLLPDDRATFPTRRVTALDRHSLRASLPGA